MIDLIFIVLGIMFIAGIGILALSCIIGLFAGAIVILLAVIRSLLELYQRGLFAQHSIRTFRQFLQANPDIKQIVENFMVFLMLSIGIGCYVILELSWGYSLLWAFVVPAILSAIFMPQEKD
ncbi:hypothetical protein B0186_04595 [Canicola haemoglobinophilus]|uniref:Uncharacterized protein n=1 Tax=Canicola haemoglobinophilus TaxID=733 RepID=A0A1V4B200_9PAST|nr:hypothetical protein [Canicola haemoglobinophilus]OOS01208.1 hypothetical protein B0186_04595 [Canicola haemoglobinophilus]STO61060.1 Uncharacterised protein [Canicola haemoglobinophilus]